MTLLASGLVAGDALMGIGLAMLVVSGLAAPLALRIPGDGAWESLATALPFAALVGGFLLYARRVRLS